MKDQTSILVSGEDGYSYLVKTEERYDLSSPRGTINTKSNTVNLDVFGRVMAGYVELDAKAAAERRVHDTAKMPLIDRAAYVFEYPIYPL